MLRVHSNNARTIRKRQKRGCFFSERNENDIAIIGQTASSYEWEKKMYTSKCGRERENQRETTASGEARERAKRTAKQTMNQFWTCFVFFLFCLCSLFILQMLELSTTFNNNTKCIAHRERERERAHNRNVGVLPIQSIHTGRALMYFVGLCVNVYCFAGLCCVFFVLNVHFALMYGLLVYFREKKKLILQMKQTYLLLQLMLLLLFIFTFFSILSSLIIFE